MCSMIFLLQLNLNMVTINTEGQKSTCAYLTKNRLKKRKEKEDKNINNDKYGSSTLYWVQISILFLFRLLIVAFLYY